MRLSIGDIKTVNLPVEEKEIDKLGLTVEVLDENGHCVGYLDRESIHEAMTLFKLIEMED